VGTEPLADRDTGTWAGVRDAAPLLASVAPLMLGLGLLQSLLGVRASIEGYAPLLVGGLMSSYYAGFLLGTIWIPRALTDVGHIRVFAALASLASAAFVLHGLFLQPAAWAVMRVVAGVCISGLTVVIESWLNGAASQKSRGQILSVYMVLVFAGIGGGQLLLNVDRPEEVGLFVLASVLVSVAVLPVSLAPRQAPVVAERTEISIREVTGLAPVASVTAVASGMAHGALLTVGAVYASAIGLRVSQVATFMAAAVFGGLSLQVPMGRLSDRIDRREVVALAAFVAAVAAAAAAVFASAETPWQITGLAAAVGAFSFPLYSLAVAHLNDLIQPQHVVPAGAKIVLAYGVGAVAGPVAASSLMSAFNPAAYMWFLVGVHAIVAAYALYRMSRWSPLEVKGSYAPVPAGGTALSFALNPEAPDDAIYPERHYKVSTRGSSVAVTEHGDGRAVVLLHDAGSSTQVWRSAMRWMPTVGLRAVGFDLRGHGDSSRASSYQVHDHVDDLDHVVRMLDEESVDLVGLGSGAVVALEYARTHSAAVRSLCLVSCMRHITSAAQRPRMAGRTASMAENTLSQIAGRRLNARRLVRTLYDGIEPSEHLELVASDITRAHPRAVSRTYADAVRSLDDVPLSLPVLVVVGDRSLAKTPDSLELFRERLGADRVRVVEGAGHFVPLDNVEGFHEALASFLVEPDKAGLEV
jgi:pimeloyl-ACP methyl ester carboxylesterase/MFS family permease